MRSVSSAASSASRVDVGGQSGDGSRSCRGCRGEGVVIGGETEGEGERRPSECRFPPVECLPRGSGECRAELRGDAREMQGR
jgi:hypothetical protein